MADEVKIYGIREDNKCFEEVVPKANTYVVGFTNLEVKKELTTKSQILSGIPSNAYVKSIMYKVVSGTEKTWRHYGPVDAIEEHLYIEAYVTDNQVTIDAKIGGDTNLTSMKIHVNVILEK